MWSADNKTNRLHIHSIRIINRKQQASVINVLGVAVGGLLIVFVAVAVTVIALVAIAVKRGQAHRR